MARLNRQSLFVQFQKSKANGLLKKEIDHQLTAQFTKAKQELIQEISDNPISKEIIAGPAIETSEFLPNGYGNLFSFIGFNAERHPIQELLEALEKNVRANPSQLARRQGTTIRYFKQIQYPSIKDIEASEVTKYDGWEGDQSSWVGGIRRGISGFAHYLSRIINNFKESRSGTAIQVKGDLHGGSHRPEPDYIEKEIAHFEKKIRAAKVKGAGIKIK